MRHPISQRQLTMISQLKNKVLMSEDRLYAIKSYSAERVMTVPKTTLFGSSEPKEKIILTNIRIIGYNKEGKFLGDYDEGWCTTFITLHNLFSFRDNWESFKLQLQAFGFKIVYADETVEAAMEKELYPNSSIES